LVVLAVAAGATGSIVATIALVGPSWFRPVLLSTHQPPAYNSVSGYTTFIVSVLAGCGDRFRLPSLFVEEMEGQEIACAILQECSADQPTYNIEVYYDGEGKCYFYDGWPRFFIEYGVQEGWFLLFSRCEGTREFFVHVIEGTLCARSFIAWV
jgi:hypothetical protein